MDVVHTVCDIALDFKFLAGIACNLLALYVIIRKSKKYLSEYRKLLVIFLLSDMLFALIHTVAKPVFVLEGNLLMIYATGPIQHRYMTSIYTACVSGTFPILLFHFMYRARAVSSSSQFVVKLSAIKLAVIIAFIACEYAAWASLILTYEYRPSYKQAVLAHFTAIGRRFPDTPRDRLVLFIGYETDGSLNVRAFKSAMMMMGIMGTTSSVMICSTIVIIRKLGTRTATNERWRKMHSQLFIALLVQLLIPCITLYIPTSFYLLTAFIPHSPFHAPPWLLTELYSWFPIADPIAIILLIGDYRKALKRIVVNLLDEKTSVCTIEVEKRYCRLFISHTLLSTRPVIIPQSPAVVLSKM